MPINKILLGYDDNEIKALKDRKGILTWDEFFLKAALQMPVIEVKA
jgi:hypothetical protein